MQTLGLEAFELIILQASSLEQWFKLIQMSVLMKNQANQATV